MKQSGSKCKFEPVALNATWKETLGNYLTNGELLNLILKLISLAGGKAIYRAIKSLFLYYFMFIGLGFKKER